MSALNIARARLAAFGGPFGLLALGAAFFFFRLFPGVRADGQIYIGRAIADLDPAGVGADAMFVHDGQSALSLFTRIAPTLVDALGPFAAARAISLAAMALWFVALVAFCMRLTRVRPWAVALAVAAAPATYSFLSYGESLPLPRPFSEAFVLLAMAAALARRRAWALLWLCVSAVFHPIMALAGFALVGLMWAMEDRRVVYGAALCALAVGLAALAGVPPFARLATMIDAEWLSLMRGRNAFLFPDTWSLDTWSLQAVQATSLIVAARVAPSLRTLFLGALGIGVAGVAVSLVAGLYVPNLLVMQAQPWRAWWLTAVLGAAALGLCATRYGEADARERLAFTLLALAWLLARGAPLEAMAAAVGALSLTFAPRVQISHALARPAFLAVAAYVLVTSAITAFKAAPLIEAMVAAGAAPTLREIVGLVFSDILLLGMLALGMFGLGFLRHAPRVVAQAGAATLAVWVALVWDSAPDYDRALYGARKHAALDALMTAPGEVLWLKGRPEAWLWAGRANWGSEVQGAGAVFSRTLAMLYRDRVAAQIEAGFGGRELIGAARGSTESYFPNVTVDGLRAICARTDAPAYVVWPMAATAALDPALNARQWTAPAARVEIADAAGKGVFQRVQLHAVAACAATRD